MGQQQYQAGELPVRESSLGPDVLGYLSAQAGRPHRAVYALRSMALAGHALDMAERGRDLTWDAMCEFAERINASGRCAELEVRTARKHQWVVTVVEGIWVGDRWTDVFEPVRRRTIFSDRWTELQPVELAAAKVGDFLNRRPDLGDGR